MNFEKLTYKYWLKRLVFQPAKGDTISVSKTVELNRGDAGHAIIRVHGTLIKTPRNPKGVFVRDSFIKVFNKSNGLIYIGQVKGSGSNYKDLKRNEIACDYDALSALGLTISEAKSSQDFVVGSGNKKDEDYFYSHFESDRGARKSHQTEMTHQRVNLAIAIWLPFIQGVLLSIFLG
jgi:hypothetical protein